MTSDQAAARLGLERRTITRYIQAGKLTAVKVGREYRIAEASVTALLPEMPIVARTTRACQTIAVVNQKGGVGKTTTTLNLTAALVRRKRAVLAVDLDPQAALSVASGLSLATLDLSIYNALCDEDLDPLTAIVRAPAGFDVLPATLDLAAAEVELASQPARDLILRDILRRVARRYDYVVVDTPPNLSLLTMNALGAADILVVPTQCEFLALRGLKHLDRIIRTVQGRLNERLRAVWILPTMVDRRLSHANETLAQLRLAYPGQVLDSVVKLSVRAKESPALGRSIFDLDPRGEVAAAYARLAEVIDHA